MELTLSVSIGESLDKLSILEIKKDKIKDTNKLIAIQHEIDTNRSVLEPYIDDYLYPCLVAINTLIWDGMDETKTKKTDLDILCKDIFANNEARFRCKKMINDKYNSNISEVKSYNAEEIYFVTYDFITSDLIDIYRKFLSFYFDNVIVCSPSLLVEKKIPLSKTYDLFSPLHKDLDYLYKLNKKPLIDKIVESYHLPPFNYIMSGALGDLVHTLYVIKIIYLKTGIKGNLYLNIFNREFRHGVNTYIDIKNFFLSQICINSVEIYDMSTRLQISLDIWRESPLMYTVSWLEILNNVYKIPMINCPWLRWDCIDEKYTDTIIINRSTWRHIDNFPWVDITKQNKCVFISFSGKDYEAFPYKENVDFIKVESFDQMATIINSCKFFIGNQSMPLALACSLHKPCLGELFDIDGIFYIGLEKYNNEYSWISATDHYFNYPSLIKGNIQLNYETQEPRIINIGVTD